MDRFPAVHAITIMGWYHLGLFAILIPRLAWRSRQHALDPALPLPPAVRHFQSQVLLLVLFGTLSLVTANLQQLDLFPLVWPSDRAVATGAAMYVIAVIAMRPLWRRAVLERRRVVQLFAADGAAARLWWIAVSVLAGISEEITWRGVQFALLTYLFGNAWAGAIGSAVMFGLGHTIQGWRSVGIITVFALAFQALVWMTGSLYVAMLVHAAYDITAGFSYGRFTRELNAREGEPAAP